MLKIPPHIGNDFSPSHYIASKHLIFEALPHFWYYLSSVFFRRHQFFGQMALFRSRLVKIRDISGINLTCQEKSWPVTKPSAMSWSFLTCQDISRHVRINLTSTNSRPNRRKPISSPTPQNSPGVPEGPESAAFFRPKPLQKGPPQTFSVLGENEFPSKRTKNKPAMLPTFYFLNCPT